MLLNINYGKRQFTVDVKEGDGKQLSITVHPDLRITAKVPYGSDKKTIEQRVKKKVSWIAKQLDYFSSFHPLAPERKYISGETHYYLGRQYRLKVRKLRNSEVKLKGSFFMIGVLDPYDSIQVKKIMNDWYAEHAAIILNDRIAKYLSKFIKLGAKEPIVKFREMNKRWGCCNGKSVVFNLKLIKAPTHCVDYVIVHELCHLLSAKHDAKFYYLLEKMLPSWKKCKERLEKTII